MIGGAIHRGIMEPVWRFEPEKNWLVFRGKSERPE
jgi:hypothetical protein